VHFSNLKISKIVRNYKEPESEHTAQTIDGVHCIPSTLRCRFNIENSPGVILLATRRVQLYSKIVANGGVCETGSDLLLKCGVLSTHNGLMSVREPLAIFIVNMT